VRYQGRIITWKDEKGFGFIAPNDDPEQVFVHISAFSDKRCRPQIDDLISFDLIKDSRGRLQAANASILGAKARVRNVGIPWGAVGVAMAALVFLFGLAFLRYVSIWIPVSSLGASVLAYFLYLQDKRAAEYSLWRTPESRLHVIAVLGGWPGALIAQYALRHKCSKQSFQIVFWFTVMLHCGAVALAGSPQGKFWLFGIARMIGGR